jgi:hypothetical protein
MRNTNGVFSQAERKAFMWALIVAAVLVGVVTAYDWIAGPSLGIYGEDMRGAAMPGVLDAQPLS